jgi:hypothetical protein
LLKEQSSAFCCRAIVDVAQFVLFVARFVPDGFLVSNRRAAASRRPAATNPALLLSASTSASKMAEALTICFDEKRLWFGGSRLSAADRWREVTPGLCSMTDIIEKSTGRRPNLAIRSRKTSMSVSAVRRAL